MKFEKLLIIVILFASCTNHKKKAETSVDTNLIGDEQVPKEKHSFVKVAWTRLKDTTINDVTLKFLQIDKVKFDSLSRFSIYTEIPLQGFGDLVVKVKDCQLIKLANGVMDTLCNKKEKSGYFQTYTINGLWKEKNQILVNFQDWEGSDDFFMDIRDGFIYHLNTEFKISPSENFMLGYTGSNLIPVLGNDFMYSSISRDSIKTYFNIDLGQVAIKNLLWLRDDECLVSTGNLSVGSGEYKVIDDKYYRMRISR